VSAQQNRSGLYATGKGRVALVDFAALYHRYGTWKHCAMPASVSESVAWTYSDGHGVDCHHMYDTSGTSMNSE
jgi:hypothetical protein